MSEDRAALHRNTAFLLAGRLVTMASFFVTYAIVGRTIGPAGFGPIALATAISAYFVAVVGPGFETFGTRDVAQDRENVHKIASGVISAKLPITLACIVAYAVVAWVPARQSHDFAAVFAIFALTIVGACINLTFVYQGLERMRYMALREAGTALLSLAGTVMFVRSPSDVIPTTLVLVGAQLANWGWLFIGYVHEFGWPHIDFSRETLWRTWRAVLPMMLSQLLIAIYVWIDTTILGYVATAHDVGLYGAASRLRMLVNTTAVIVLSAHLPLLARSVTDLERLQSAASGYARTMYLVSAPVTIFLAFFSYDAIVFAFGPSFAPIAPTLSILMLVVMGSCVNMTYGNPLQVWNRETAFLKIIFWGAAFNAIANLITIPLLGPIGAASVDLCTEGLLLLLFLREYRALGLRSSLSHFLAFAVLAVIASGVARAAVWFFLDHAPPFWHLAAGGIVMGLVYALMVLATGLYKIGSVNMLIQRQSRT